MAQVPPSSAVIYGILIDAKTFVTQHYLIVISAVVFLRLFYLRYLSPYRDIPGPFLATISPLWRLRAALNGTINNDITECHRKYGAIFRISPDEVSISDPEAIKVIYAHGAGFTKVGLLRFILT
jgi:cytochrome P450